MGRRRHVTLLASLPGLPPLETAERLPINEPRLMKRLDLLHPEDRQDLGTILDLVRWKEVPQGRSDAQHAARYRRALQDIRSPKLRGHLHYRMGQRGVLAALRYRQQHPEATPTILPCGREFGDHTHWILAHWSLADFGLGTRFSWVSDALGHLQRGEALALERLMLRLVHRAAAQLQQRATPFSTEQVCAYVLRWDVLRRWLSYRDGDGRPRFHRLLTDLTSEHALGP